MTKSGLYNNNGQILNYYGLFRIILNYFCVILDKFCFTVRWFLNLFGPFLIGSLDVFLSRLISACWQVVRTSYRKWKDRVSIILNWCSSVCIGKLMSEMILLSSMLKLSFYCLKLFWPTTYPQVTSWKFSLVNYQKTNTSRAPMIVSTTLSLNCRSGCNF